MTAEQINARLERLMPVLTPLGIVLGFSLPGVFIHLRPLVPWLFGTMTLSGALKLQAAEFGRTLRNPLPVLLFFVSVHIIMPLLALSAASLCFHSSADTVSGFVLLFSGPTAVSGFMWVSMYMGDKALCLALILLDTLLAPLLVPGTISLLMGTKVTMDMGGIAVSLILMVVVPTVIGVTANEVSRGKIPSRLCPYLNPVSKIFLMLVIAANTAPAAPRIRLDEPRLWGIAALCVVLSAVGFALARLSGIAGRCDTGRSITLFFSGGLRNISAVTTIAVTFFPEAAALPALLGIVFQQSLSAVMARLLVRRQTSQGNTD
ncbi:MAG: bile acid:sodium symporter family protein [Treponema sp.]|jgi:predicted Na+-dependent transporter|nr:bile acid:sodium symporter family protein [Treponema sp.]